MFFIQTHFQMAEGCSGLKFFIFFYFIFFLCFTGGELKIIHTATYYILHSYILSIYFQIRRFSFLSLIYSLSLGRVTTFLQSLFYTSVCVKATSRIKLYGIDAKQFNFAQHFISNPLNHIADFLVLWVRLVQLNNYSHL